MSEQQMSYGYNETSDVTLTVMEAGIHENVMLTNIAAEGSKQDGSGDPVIRFYFKEEGTGLEFNHTEFMITEAGCAKFAASIPGKTTASVMADEFKHQGERIRHILKCFIPADQLVLKATTWEEFRAAVVGQAGAAYKNVLLKIKLTLNKKDFVQFPKRPMKPFCLRMDDKEQSMAIDKKWDRITPVPVDPAYGKIEGELPAGVNTSAAKW